MPSAHARAHARLVTRTARTLDVPLPEAFTQRVEAGNQLVTAVETIPHPGELIAAVLNAIAAGRDYHTDKDVNRLLLDSVVSQLGIGSAARGRADDDVQDALVEHADTILTGWADALDPHSQALLAAAAALPADLDSTQAIINRGAEAMHHWAAAHSAIKLWRAGVEGFMALAMTARVSATKRSPLIVTAADVATLGEAEGTAIREGRPVDVWMLARHQIPLRLATLGDYMERVAIHAQQRQAAERHFEEQRSERRKAVSA